MVEITQLELENIINIKNKCCKCPKKEILENFNTLSERDKILLVGTVIDTEYEWIENVENDPIKNELVKAFTKIPGIKKYITQLHDGFITGESSEKINFSYVVESEDELSYKTTMKLIKKIEKENKE